MSDRPKLTLAERQANWRRNREAREQALRDALDRSQEHHCRIYTVARTIREARAIAGEALGEKDERSNDFDADR